MLEGDGPAIAEDRARRVSACDDRVVVRVAKQEYGFCIRVEVAGNGHFGNLLKLSRAFRASLDVFGGLSAGGWQAKLSDDAGRRARAFAVGIPLLASDRVVELQRQWTRGLLGQLTGVDRKGGVELILRWLPCSLSPEPQTPAPR